MGFIDGPLILNETICIFEFTIKFVFFLLCNFINLIHFYDRLKILRQRVINIKFMGKKDKGKIYIVEDIIDTKMVNGNCLFYPGLQHYKVKWKDYPISDCTWQPEQSFNCPKDVLYKFLEARSLKFPAFKEKINQIEKQKQLMNKKV